MDKQALLELLNASPPPAFGLLGGRGMDIDGDAGTSRLEFRATPAMCNPHDGVQGGFICGMLDAAMAIAAIGRAAELIIVATLEIKVSYLEVTRPGDLVASGRIVRQGKTVWFLEADLRDADGKRLATGSQTARVIRPAGAAA